VGEGVEGGSEKNGWLGDLRGIVGLVMGDWGGGMCMGKRIW
jgi:hypothetical protein